MRRMPPLVFAGECRTLQDRLAQCAAGKAFMLQVRPCALLHREHFPLYNAHCRAGRAAVLLPNLLDEAPRAPVCAHDPSEVLLMPCV